MASRREIILFALVAVGSAAVGAGATFFLAHPTRVEVAVG